MSNELVFFSFFNYAANCRLRPPYVLFVEPTCSSLIELCNIRYARVLRIADSKTVRVVELAIINNTRAVPLSRLTLQTRRVGCVWSQRRRKYGGKRKERTCWSIGGCWCSPPNWKMTSMSGLGNQLPARRVLAHLAFPLVLARERSASCTFRVRDRSR